MKKNKILVIDDEQDFLRITKLNLEKTGKYEVKTLSSAENLIQIVHEFEPKLILLDILMSKVDGVQACRLLNEDPAAKNIPIIILSALSKIKDKLMMYKLGVIDYLTKPVEKSELVAKIEKALRVR